VTTSPHVNSLMFRQANQFDAGADVTPSFCKNMRLAADPGTEQASTPSGGLAAGQPQTLPHLVEKPSNLVNLQAIAGQHGVQDRVIEKVIERGLRSSVIHGWSPKLNCWPSEPWSKACHAHGLRGYSGPDRRRAAACHPVPEAAL
jgi:hypothetical protein